MAQKSNAASMEQRSGQDRREGADRRQQEQPVAQERRQGNRRKVQRRRQIDPTTCERDYSGDEIEFMQALDAYKRASGRMFPTCSEILEVIRDLGYRRLAPDEIASHDAAFFAAAQEAADAEEDEGDDGVDVE